MKMRIKTTAQSDNKLKFYLSISKYITSGNILQISIHNIVVL